MYYAVNAGDSLWRISRILTGEGHHWPKLQLVNRELTNPDLIYPGDVLFVPPSMQVRRLPDGLLGVGSLDHNRHSLYTSTAMGPGD